MAEELTALSFGTDQNSEGLSDRVLDSRSRGCGCEPHPRHCIVSLSKTLYPLLSTSSTEEDPF